VLGESGGSALRRLGANLFVVVKGSHADATLGVNVLTGFDETADGAVSADLIVETSAKYEFVKDATDASGLCVE
jgi:hypothetical protein